MTTAVANTQRSSERATMKKIHLAKTDLEVSQLCLGTNQFGTQTNAAQAAEILEAFTRLGGNFLDTAHSYGDWIPSDSRQFFHQRAGPESQITHGPNRASA